MPQPQHVFEKPEVIINGALGMLVPNTKLLQIVTTIGFDQFKGKKDDTITIRVPARTEARSYAFRNTVRDAIVTDTLTEEAIDVTLDKMRYSAVAITDEQLTLDITDFQAQITLPQADAIARYIENDIGSGMDAADLTDANELEIDSDDDPWTDLFVPARRALNDAHVPESGRFMIVGADVEDWLLTQDESFRRADAQGQDALDLLHNAILGRKAGFTVVGGVDTIDPGVAYALHPSAFAYVTGAPANPRGAKASAAASYKGVAMRVLYDYDADHLTDRSVLSTFAGFQSVEDEREQEMSEDGSFPLTGKNCRAARITFSQAS